MVDEDQQNQYNKTTYLMLEKSRGSILSGSNRINDGAIAFTADTGNRSSTRIFGFEK